MPEQSFSKALYFQQIERTLYALYNVSAYFRTLYSRADNLLRLLFEMIKFSTYAPSVPHSLSLSPSLFPNRVNFIAATRRNLSLMALATP